MQKNLIQALGAAFIGQRERLTARWTHKVLVFFLPKWFSHHSIINITDDIVLTRSDHRTTHV